MGTLENFIIGSEDKDWCLHMLGFFSFKYHIAVYNTYIRDTV